MAKGRFRIGIGTLIAGVILVGFLGYEFTRAKSARAAPEERVTPPVKLNVFADGRVVSPPGTEVTVSSEIGGRIAQLLVREHERVEKGQPLGAISTSQEAAQLAEARARIREAKVDLDFFKSELVRTEQLGRGGVIPEADLDRAKHEVDAAEARLRTMHSSLLKLEDIISRAKLAAPIAGTITEQLADEGEVITPGAPLLTIVDLTELRVEVEIGEFDISRVKLGDRALVSAEGLGEKKFEGSITEIPSSVTSRRLKPLDPGRPSDTRVLPVKVSLPKDHPLKLGQRVEVEIVKEK